MFAGRRRGRGRGEGSPRQLLSVTRHGLLDLVDDVHAAMSSAVQPAVSVGGARG